MFLRLVFLVALVIPIAGLAQPADQVITFDPVPPKVFGDPNFLLTAVASSGLPVTYTSSKNSVITISGSTAFIMGTGEVTITALQAGNTSFKPAAASQVLFVRKAPQTINFPAFGTKSFDNLPFDPGATGVGLPITYTSSDPSIAAIINNKVNIINTGTVDITASQVGNDNYQPAVSVTQTLIIQKASVQSVLSFLGSVPLQKIYGDAPFVVSLNINTGAPVEFTSQYDSIATVSGNVVTIHGAGSTLLTAKQLENRNYLSAQTSRLLVVDKATQTITFVGPLPVLTLGGSPLPVSASASSGLPVQFSSYRAVVAVNGNSMVPHSLGTGSVTASQPGNHNYYPAAPVSLPVTVTGTPVPVFPILGSTYLGGVGAGTLFKMNNDGTGIAVPKTFDRNSNNLPTGGLLKASNGKLYGLIQAGGIPANGVVYSLDADGTNYTVLHNFSFGDGSAPVGNLIEASNGYLYGATTYGGTGSGVIFRIQKDGSGFSVVHNFTTGALAGLMEASDGKLYGTTFAGGTVGYGSIYKINLDGTGFTEIFSFDGPGSGNTPRGVLIQGPDSYLYGMTTGGGSNSMGVLYKVQTSGANFTKLVEFDGMTTGSYGSSSLIFGSNGKLFGMTQHGGANDYGTIFTVASDGTGFVTLFDFDLTSSGAAPLGSLIESANDGYLYGMTNVGGSADRGVIFKVKKDGTGFTKLEDFTGANGANPELGPLVEVQAGLFFGMTSRGGISEAGTIFSITSGGTHSLLKEFPQPPNRPSVLVSNEATTEVFGILSVGGPTGNGNAFRVNPDGTGYTDLPPFAGNYLTADNLVHVSDNTLWGVAHEGVTDWSYHIFKMNADGTNFQRIQNLDNPALGVGLANLIEYDATYLYGTASGGGTADRGTVFRIKKDGTGMTKLSDFTGGSEGATPLTGLIRHSNGNLYGVTDRGGAEDFGVLFSINAAGQITKVFELNLLTGLTAKKVIELKGGSLAVITGQGGLTPGGSLFIVDEKGQGLKVVFSFVTDSGISPVDLFQTLDGTIYVLLSGQGTNGNGALFKVLPDGTGFAKVYDFVTATGSVPTAMTTVKQTQSVIAFDAIPNKVYTDAPFLLTSTTSTGAAAGYTSSNESVATVEGNRVTLRGVGTVTISAHVPANANFRKSPSIDRTFTVSKGDHQILFDALPVKQYLDPPFKVKVSTTSGTPVSLTSSNPSVASIDHGVITIHTPGSTTITATTSSPLYNAIPPVQRELVVEKRQTAIAFHPIGSRYVDRPPFAIVATHSGVTPVMLSSGNTAVATLAGNVATLVSVGQSLITATANSDANYLAPAPVDQPLTVIRNNQSINFNPVPDHRFDAGSFYFLVPGATSGLPVNLSSSNAHVTISGEQITMASPGSVTLTAEQPGNSAYNPAANIAQTFCILPPTPVLTVEENGTGGATLHSSATTGNQWYRNDVLIAGENGASLILDKSGTYSVKVSIEGCVSDLSNKETVTVVGLEDQSKGFSIYPNPVEETLYVTFANPGHTNVELSMMDMLGKELFNITSKDEQVALDIRSLPSGVYLLRVGHEGSLTVSKLVKR